MKTVLTDLGLKALKPAPKGSRRELWDAACPSLGVRVTDTGHVSFFVLRRPAGASKPVRLTLGAYPSLSLADAREKAEAALKLLVKGKDPREVEAAAQAEKARAAADTFGVALGKFLGDGELEGRRSRRETEAILRREFLGEVPKRKRLVVDGRAEWQTEWSPGPDPIWSNKPISEIARRDVVERLDAIKRRGGKHAARHALGAVRRFLSWCAEGERFGIEVSPCAGVRDKTIGISGRDLRRQRVLGDAELRDVWHAAAATGYPFGPLVQLLALTGQRLNDVASARWTDIDLDAAMLRVPPERFKTEAAHEVPLAPRAVAILRKLPRFSGSFVFTTTSGARPLSGFAKMKARLDETIAKQRKKDGREEMPNWVLHDLRRTLRTRLVGDLGTDAYIAERVIGHALPGLNAVYDQGSHRGPKRQALEAWAARLLSIVEPPAARKGQKARGSDVVPFARVQ